MCTATTYGAPMQQAPAKPSTREAILDAAETVVSREGGARLTIDAVVVESGFSKGGVLYHFPNKTALLQAMLGRMIERVGQEVLEAEASAQAAGAPLAPAIIKALLMHRKSEPGVSVALLAASAEQPELLDPARAFVTETVNHTITDAPDPTLALIALLATDGLHFNELLGINYVTDAQREAIQTRLIRMMQEMYT